MRRLEGKVAHISGTARGQGRAAALRFAAEDAIVVGGYLLHEAALEIQRLVAEAGGTALTPAPLDVTDEDSLQAWREEVVDAFGGTHVLRQRCADVVRSEPEQGAITVESGHRPQPPPAGALRLRDGGIAVRECRRTVACAGCSHPVRHRPRQSRADAAHGVQVVRTVALHLATMNRARSTVCGAMADGRGLGRVQEPGLWQARTVEDDLLMRIRREVRWVLWGLWLACLMFSVWFFTEAITLFLQAESW
ncbi:SDR family oxidoreductase [Streptomyces sp. NPDC010273]|uniref:SDR family oxidoreductase n=1 Tax=Streptomyces sp. NPDC010273 TaxID=3364829 RepID=UPI0036EA8547